MFSCQEDYLQVDKLFTRKEAASLYCTYVFLLNRRFGPSIFSTSGTSFGTDLSLTTNPFRKLLRGCPSYHLCLSSSCALRTGVQRLSRLASLLCGAQMVGRFKSFSGSLMTLLTFCFGFFRRRSPESFQKWPEQLSSWVLVLLRKIGDVCPTWSLVCPITSAGVCYRIWSRVRTAQLMSHAKAISKPLVSPCLNTRAIWIFLGDLISSKISAHKHLAGPVLDITKCSNILDRRLPKALMLRFGFPAVIVDAWLILVGYAFAAFPNYLG